MDFNARFAKIVGSSSFGRDSWTLAEEKSFLLLDLAVSSPSAPMAETGRKIIDDLWQKLGRLQNISLLNLKALVKDVSPPNDAVLNLILGIENKGIFYLICQGLGRVMIKREDRLGIILENEGAVCGPIKKSDIFLFFSPRFLEIVGEEEIKNFLDNHHPEEIAESLTPLLHRAEDTSGSACLILRFDLAQRKQIPPEAESTATLFHKLKNKLRSLLIFIVNHKPNRPFFLLMLLILSIVFSFKKQNSNQKQNKFNQVYELTQHQLEQGKALIGLNNLRAVGLLVSAKASLVNLQKDFEQKSQSGKTIKDLLIQIDKELESAKQIYKVSPEVFFDLTLLKTGGQGEKMAIDKEQIFVLDQKNAVVYQIDAKTKAGKIIAEKDQPQDLKQTKAIDESQNFNTAGLNKPLGKDALVFTNQETVNSYVWDRSNKRVVVFDQKDNYQNQYQWSSNENYSAMVVSEDLKLILLLEGSKIDSIKMSSPTLDQVEGRL